MAGDELRFLFLFVTGDEFPDADEDLLRALADAWVKAARRLSEELGPSLRRTVATIRSTFTGPAEQAFAAVMTPFVADPESYLDSSAWFFQQVALMLRQLALDAEYMKYVVILELEMLKAEFSWSFAVYPLLGPAVLAWLAVRVKMVARALKPLVKAWIKRLRVLVELAVKGRRYLTAITVSMGNQMLVTTGAQAIQRLKGTRTDWENRYFQDAAVVGAIGGATAAGALALGHVDGLSLSQLLDDILVDAHGTRDWHKAFAHGVSHVFHEAIHEGTTATLANLALTKQFVLSWSDFTAGGTSGVGRVSGHALGHLAGKPAVVELAAHSGHRDKRKKSRDSAGHPYRDGGPSPDDGFFGEDAGPDDRAGRRYAGIPAPRDNRTPGTLRGPGHDGVATGGAASGQDRAGPGPGDRVPSASGPAVPTRAPGPERATASAGWSSAAENRLTLRGGGDLTEASPDSGDSEVESGQMEPSGEQSPVVPERRYAHAGGSRAPEVSGRPYPNDASAVLDRAMRGELLEEPADLRDVIKDAGGFPEALAAQSALYPGGLPGHIGPGSTFFGPEQAGSGDHGREVIEAWLEENHNRASVVTVGYPDRPTDPGHSWLMVKENGAVVVRDLLTGTSISLDEWKTFTQYHYFFALPVDAAGQRVGLHEAGGGRYLAQDLGEDLASSLRDHTKEYQHRLARWLASGYPGRKAVLAGFRHLAALMWKNISPEDRLRVANTDPETPGAALDAEAVIADGDLRELIALFWGIRQRVPSLFAGEWPQPSAEIETLRAQRSPSATEARYQRAKEALDAAPGSADAQANLRTAQRELRTTVPLASVRPRLSSRELELAVVYDEDKDKAVLAWRRGDRRPAVPATAAANRTARRHGAEVWSGVSEAAYDVLTLTMLANAHWHAGLDPHLMVLGLIENQVNTGQDTYHDIMVTASLLVPGLRYYGGVLPLPPLREDVLREVAGGEFPHEQALKKTDLAFETMAARLRLDWHPRLRARAHALLETIERLQPDSDPLRFLQDSVSALERLPPSREHQPAWQRLVSDQRIGSIGPDDPDGNLGGLLETVAAALDQDGAGVPRAAVHREDPATRPWNVVRVLATARTVGPFSSSEGKNAQALLGQVLTELLSAGTDLGNFARTVRALGTARLVAQDLRDGHDGFTLARTVIHDLLAVKPRTGAMVEEEANSAQSLPGGLLQRAKRIVRQVFASMEDMGIELWDFAGTSRALGTTVLVARELLAGNDGTTLAWSIMDDLVAGQRWTGTRVRERAESAGGFSDDEVARAQKVVRQVFHQLRARGTDLGNFPGTARVWGTVRLVAEDLRDGNDGITLAWSIIRDLLGEKRWTGETIDLEDTSEQTFSDDVLQRTKQTVRQVFTELESMGIELWDFAGTSRALGTAVLLARKSPRRKGRHRLAWSIMDDLVAGQRWTGDRVRDRAKSAGTFPVDVVKNARELVRQAFDELLVTGVQLRNFAGTAREWEAIRLVAKNLRAGHDGITLAQTLVHHLFAEQELTARHREMVAHISHPPQEMTENTRVWAPSEVTMADTISASYPPQLVRPAGWTAEHWWYAQAPPDSDVVTAEKFSRFAGKQPHGPGSSRPFHRPGNVLTVDGPGPVRVNFLRDAETFAVFAHRHFAETDEPGILELFRSYRPELVGYGMTLPKALSDTTSLADKNNNVVPGSVGLLYGVPNGPKGVGEPFALGLLADDRRVRAARVSEGKADWSPLIDTPCDFYALLLTPERSKVWGLPWPEPPAFGWPLGGVVDIDVVMEAYGAFQGTLGLTFTRDPLEWLVEHEPADFTGHPEKILELMNTGGHGTSAVLFGTRRGRGPKPWLLVNSHHKIIRLEIGESITAKIRRLPTRWVKLAAIVVRADQVVLAGKNVSADAESGPPQPVTMPAEAGRSITMAALLQHPFTGAADLIDSYWMAEANDAGPPVGTDLSYAGSGRRGLLAIAMRLLSGENTHALVAAFPAGDTAGPTQAPGRLWHLEVTSVGDSRLLITNYDHDSGGIDVTKFRDLGAVYGVVADGTGMIMGEPGRPRPAALTVLDAEGTGPGTGVTPVSGGVPEPGPEEFVADFGAMWTRLEEEAALADFDNELSGYEEAAASFEWKFARWVLTEHLDEVFTQIKRLALAAWADLPFRGDDDEKIRQGSVITDPAVPGAAHDGWKVLRDGNIRQVWTLLRGVLAATDDGWRIWGLKVDPATKAEYTNMRKTKAEIERNGLFLDGPKTLEAMEALERVDQAMRTGLPVDEVWPPLSDDEKEISLVPGPDGQPKLAWVPAERRLGLPLAHPSHRQAARTGARLRSGSAKFIGQALKLAWHFKQAPPGIDLDLPWLHLGLTAIGIRTEDLTWHEGMVAGHRVLPDLLRYSNTYTGRYHLGHRINAISDDQVREKVGPFPEEVAFGMDTFRAPDTPSEPVVARPPVLAGRWTDSRVRPLLEWAYLTHSLGPSVAMTEPEVLNEVIGAKQKITGYIEVHHGDDAGTRLQDIARAYDVAYHAFRDHHYAGALAGAGLGTAAITITAAELLPDPTTTADTRPDTTGTTTGPHPDPATTAEARLGAIATAVGGPPATRNIEHLLPALRYYAEVTESAGRRLGVEGHGDPVLRLVDRLPVPFGLGEAAWGLAIEAVRTGGHEGPEAAKLADGLAALVIETAPERLAHRAKILFNSDGVVYLWNPGTPGPDDTKVPATPEAGSQALISAIVARPGGEVILSGLRTRLSVKDLGYPERWTIGNLRQVVDEIAASRPLRRSSLARLLVRSAFDARMGKLNVPETGPDTNRKKDAEAALKEDLERAEVVLTHAFAAGVSMDARTIADHLVTDWDHLARRRSTVETTGMDAVLDFHEAFQASFGATYTRDPRQWIEAHKPEEFISGQRNLGELMSRMNKAKPGASGWAAIEQDGSRPQVFSAYYDGHTAKLVNTAGVFRLGRFGFTLGKRMRAVVVDVDGRALAGTPESPLAGTADLPQRAPADRGSTPVTKLLEFGTFLRRFAGAEAALNLFWLGVSGEPVLPAALGYSAHGLAGVARAAAITMALAPNARALVTDSPAEGTSPPRVWVFERLAGNGEVRIIYPDGPRPLDLKSFGTVGAVHSLVVDKFGKIGLHTTLGRDDLFFTGRTELSDLEPVSASLFQARIDYAQHEEEFTRRLLKHLADKEIDELTVEARKLLIVVLERYPAMTGRTVQAQPWYAFVPGAGTVADPLAIAQKGTIRELFAEISRILWTPAAWTAIHREIRDEKTRLNKREDKLGLARWNVMYGRIDDKDALRRLQETEWERRSLRPDGARPPLSAREVERVVVPGPDGRAALSWRRGDCQLAWPSMPPTVESTEGDHGITISGLDAEVYATLDFAVKARSPGLDLHKLRRGLFYWLASTEQASYSDIMRAAALVHPSLRYVDNLARHEWFGLSAEELLKCTDDGLLPWQRVLGPDSAFARALAEVGTKVKDAAGVHVVVPVHRRGLPQRMLTEYGHREKMAAQVKKLAGMMWDRLDDDEHDMVARANRNPLHPGAADDVHAVVTDGNIREQTRLLQTIVELPALGKKLSGQDTLPPEVEAELARRKTTAADLGIPAITDPDHAVPELSEREKRVVVVTGPDGRPRLTWRPSESAGDDAAATGIEHQAPEVAARPATQTAEDTEARAERVSVPAYRLLSLVPKANAHWDADLDLHTLAMAFYGVLGSTGQATYHGVMRARELVEPTFRHLIDSRRYGLHDPISKDRPDRDFTGGDAGPDKFSFTEILSVLELERDDDSSEAGEAGEAESEADSDSGDEEPAGQRDPLTTWLEEQEQAAAPPGRWWRVWSTDDVLGTKVPDLATYDEEDITRAYRVFKEHPDAPALAKAGVGPKAIRIVAHVLGSKPDADVTALLSEMWAGLRVRARKPHAWLEFLKAPLAFHLRRLEHRLPAGQSVRTHLTEMIDKGQGVMFLGTGRDRFSSFVVSKRNSGHRPAIGIERAPDGRFRAWNLLFEDGTPYLVYQSRRGYTRVKATPNLVDADSTFYALGALSGDSADRSGDSADGPSGEMTLRGAGSPAGRTVTAALEHVTGAVTANVSEAIRRLRRRAPEFTALGGTRPATVTRRLTSNGTYAPVVPGEGADAYAIAEYEQNKRAHQMRAADEAGEDIPVPGTSGILVQRPGGLVLTGMVASPEFAAELAVTLRRDVIALALGTHAQDPLRPLVFPPIGRPLPVKRGDLPPEVQALLDSLTA